VAHAGLVTITHHHGNPQRLLKIAVGVSCDSDSGGASDTSKDTGCPSCCLQRNFVTSIQPILIPPDLCPEPVSSEIFTSEAISNNASFTLSNRAPPLG